MHSLSLRQEGDLRALFAINENESLKNSDLFSPKISQDLVELVDNIKCCPDNKVEDSEKNIEGLDEKEFSPNFSNDCTENADNLNSCPETGPKDPERNSSSRDDRSLLMNVTKDIDKKLDDRHLCTEVDPKDDEGNTNAQDTASSPPHLTTECKINSFPETTTNNDIPYTPNAIDGVDEELENEMHSSSPDDSFTNKEVKITVRNEELDGNEFPPQNRNESDNFTSNENNSIVDTLEKLRKSEENNLKLKIENDSLRKSLNALNEAAEDEWSDRMQKLKTEHESLLQRLVKNHETQLSEIQSDLEEKDSMIKLLRDDINRYMSELMNFPDKEVDEDEDEDEESQTDKLKPHDNINLEMEKELMRKQLEEKDYELATANASLAAYEGERVDFQEELKELNERVIQLEESEKAWNKLEIGFVLRIRNTEREKDRLGKQLKSTQQILESLRHQSEPSTSSTSPKETKNVHFGETSFEFKPKIHDVRLQAKEVEAETHCSTFGAQTKQPPNPSNIFSSNDIKVNPANESSKQTGGLFDNKSGFKIKFFEPLDSASKEPMSQPEEIRNVAESNESHPEKDQTLMDQKFSRPPYESKPEASVDSLFSSDSQPEGLFHKVSSVTALTKCSEISVLTPECTETVNSGSSDSTSDSFEHTVNKICSETSKSSLQPSTDTGYLAGKTVHKGFGRENKIVKITDERSANPKLAEAASAINKEMKEKMKILTSSPQLWLKFKARLSSSHYGTGALAMQTVLQELIEEHPEIEELFAAKQEQKRKRLETIAEIKRREEGGNDNSITRRLSIFVSSMYNSHNSTEEKASSRFSLY